MRLAALVLAAGASRRAGAVNKLLARDRAGCPMIVRSVGAALGSRADDVIVVLGHDRARIAGHLHAAGRAGHEHRLRVVLAHDHAEGMAASLRCGIRHAIVCRSQAALVCLGDMPLVRAGTLDRLADCLEADPAALACIPTLDGIAGNPVLWRGTLFDRLLGLTGDRGGKALLGRHAVGVREVPVDDPGIVEDFDTPERLAGYGLR